MHTDDLDAVVTQALEGPERIVGGRWAWNQRQLLLLDGLTIWAIITPQARRVLFWQRRWYAYETSQGSQRADRLVDALKGVHTQLQAAKHAGTLAPMSELEGRFIRIKGDPHA